MRLDCPSTIEWGATKSANFAFNAVPGTSENRGGPFTGSRYRQLIDIHAIYLALALS
jgi:hypothetical protein